MVFVELCESLLRVEAARHGHHSHSADSLLLRNESILLHDTQQVLDESTSSDNQRACCRTS